MIAPEDEALHPPGTEPHWQESFYFNWADTSGEVLGLARIGYRVGEDRVDGLVLSIRDGRPEFCYPGVNLRRRGAWDDQNPEDGFRAGRLTFEVDEPLGRFRIRLDGRHRIDLEWTACTPAFDFAGARNRFAPDVAAEHFEQAGRVRGWTEFRGRRVEIDGTGQRDKSWGPRDWGTVSGWDWISGQFEDGTAFNATRVRGPGGKLFPAGFVHHDGTNREIVDLGIEYVWGSRPHVPRTVGLVLTDDTDRQWSVTGTALGRCPLARRGAWIEETHARFEIDGGEHGPGYGVIEHVWRPSRLETLRLLPELGALVRVMVRP